MEYSDKKPDFENHNYIHDDNEPLLDLKNQNLNYEQERKILKYGALKSSVLIYQMTVGIAMYTLQKPLYEAGILWGVLVSFIMYYATTYGLVQIAQIVDKLEAENPEGSRVISFYGKHNHLNSRFIG